MQKQRQDEKGISVDQAEDKTCIIHNSMVHFYFDTNIYLIDSLLQMRLDTSCTNGPRSLNLALSIVFGFSDCANLVLPSLYDHYLNKKMSFLTTGDTTTDQSAPVTCIT